MGPVFQRDDRLAVARESDSTTFRVSGFTHIPEQELASLWHLYVRAFGGLATRAASRHVMERVQFDTEMADGRITKFVAFHDSQPVGLLTITSDLDSIVWVSPDFYRNKYATKARRGLIFFVTNLLTDPDYHGHEPFLMLTEAACRLAAGGVLGFDVCQSNAHRGLPQAVRRRVSQLHGGACTFEELDSQTFYGIDLTGPLLQDS